MYVVWMSCCLALINDSNGADQTLDTCIGYNSLYIIPGLTVHNGPGLPDGKRLWSWILLCDDGM